MKRILTRLIDGIYEHSKEPITLEYCDDENVYAIYCSLNWDEPTKEQFIKNINAFDTKIKKLPKFDANEVVTIFNRYFNSLNNDLFKDHLLTRSIRLNKLYQIKAPKIIINKEKELLVILLVINSFAINNTIDVKKG